MFGAKLGPDASFSHCPVLALYTSSEPGRMSKEITSPTTEVSLVRALEPMSPHHARIDPVPARNCWNPVVFGSAFSWSAGSEGSASTTSWIARTHAGLLILGFIES